MSRLAAVVDGIPQIQTAYFVARSLSEENRLRLASACSSDRYRFAALLSISLGDHVFTGLGDEVENELAALLEQVSQNADQWTQWMLAFNEYPIRFPALQRPLGRALAQAPKRALAAYVDSISLNRCPFGSFSFHDPSRLDGRQSVALCLSAFRDYASAGQRLGLWGLAHTRWTNWAFAYPTMHSNSLTGIVGSELDYAITAHAAENLSPVERDTQLTSLTNAIRDIEMSWYSSFSELIGRRNFLLSTLQPLLAVNEPNWLYERPVVPKQLVEDAYTRQKYKT